MSERDNGKPNTVVEIFYSDPDLNADYSDSGKLILVS